MTPEIFDFVGGTYVKTSIEASLQGKRRRNVEVDGISSYDVTRGMRVKTSIEASLQSTALLRGEFIACGFFLKIRFLLSERKKPSP